MKTFFEKMKKKYIFIKKKLLFKKAFVSLRRVTLLNFCVGKPLR